MYQNSVRSEEEAGAALDPEVANSFSIVAVEVSGHEDIPPSVDCHRVGQLAVDVRRAVDEVLTLPALKAFRCGKRAGSAHTSRTVA